MKLTDVAGVAHNAIAAICVSIGDDVYVGPWEDAPAWQVESVCSGVNQLLTNPDLTPGELHDLWVQHQNEAGWVYGPVKDAEAKTHPCLVPYYELPSEQRTKDAVFHAVVKSLILRIGRVDLPTTKDEAHTMAVLGTNWLAANGEDEPVFDRAAVFTVISQEKLEGEIPDDMFRDICSDKQMLMGYSEMLVEACKRSILTQLGFKIPCQCGNEECFEPMGEHCGLHLIMAVANGGEAPNEAQHG